MTRGTTLGELETQLRLAARLDPNPALSLNLVPLMHQTIRDTQERIYDEFDWPFLKVQPDKTMAAGQRFYDIPANLNLERIISVDIKHGGEWIPVERGITLDHYNNIDSDEDDRMDPVQRWEVRDTGSGEQIEVWPIPASDGDLLRFSGIRKLNPLVERSDRADIDDQLITLFAAGEMLGGAKNEAAQIKFSQANTRLALLQGRVTKRRSNSFVLGGEPNNHDRERTPLVAYVRAP